MCLAVAGGVSSHAFWEPGCVNNISLGDDDWHACQKSDCQPQELKGGALSILLWCHVCWPDIPSPALSCGLGLRYLVMYLGCRRNFLFVLKGRQSLWFSVKLVITMCPVLAKLCYSSCTVQIHNWCTCWVFWSVCNRGVWGSWQHAGQVRMEGYKFLTSAFAYANRLSWTRLQNESCSNSCLSISPPYSISSFFCLLAKCTALHSSSAAILHMANL